MFQLNPHGLTDAWWQHLLMIVVATLLGYIIGFRSRKPEEDIQEQELLRLSNVLEHCKRGLTAQIPRAVHMSPKKTTQADTSREDLKVIEGIGPKIERILNHAGINNLYQLATASTDQLKEILADAGPKFRMHDPSTWAQQALMAHQGKWEELKAWQDELIGGKPE
ncbi:hypothetical protein [Dyadobacter tibetensis]|uniref:hypothetical protein n=1 Tax=Dyadobacter tibetensis TaxID=1211851 RepID=UPI000472DF2A|nr:hypothetical protein [Dyadobacter tibetensis]